jgi:NAD(P)-dependent dehydrogenase (short-subunit alcohol dehydrogenase family)
MSLKEFEKVILVTGAGGALGSGLLEGLIESGYKNVIGHYRKNSKLLIEILEKHNLSVERYSYCASLVNEEDVKSMHQHIANNFGATYAVINVAGSSTNSMSWKLSLKDFKETIDNNLISTFLTCKEFIPDMRESCAGRIINVSSVVAHTGVVGSSHYCASKSAIEGFTRSLSLELSSKDITANTIALGYFDSGIIDQVPEQAKETIKKSTPLKRFGKTQEFTEIVKYLLSDSSQFMTGQVLHLNGGYHL